MPEVPRTWINDWKRAEELFAALAQSYSSRLNSRSQQPGLLQRDLSAIQQLLDLMDGFKAALGAAFSQHQTTQSITLASKISWLKKHLQSLAKSLNESAQQHKDTTLLMDVNRFTPAALEECRRARVIAAELARPPAATENVSLARVTRRGFLVGGMAAGGIIGAGFMQDLRNLGQALNSFVDLLLGIKKLIEDLGLMNPRRFDEIVSHMKAADPKNAGLYKEFQERRASALLKFQQLSTRFEHFQYDANEMVREMQRKYGPDWVGKIIESKSGIIDQLQRLFGRNVSEKNYVNNYNKLKATYERAIKVQDRLEREIIRAYEQHGLRAVQPIQRMMKAHVALMRFQEEVYAANIKLGEDNTKLFDGYDSRLNAAESMEKEALRLAGQDIYERDIDFTKIQYAAPIGGAILGRKVAHALLGWTKGLDKATTVKVPRRRLFGRW